MNKQRAIEFCLQQGACVDAMDWLITQPGTVKQIYERCNDSPWWEWLYKTCGLTDEYERVKASAWAEPKRVIVQAWAEYERVITTWAEYERVIVQAWAEYERVKALAWAEYERDRKLPWTIVLPALAAAIKKSLDGESLRCPQGNAHE